MPREGGVPEHCRIFGQILPEIRFEVDLPSVWNQRMYMHGNGGFAGEPFDSPGRIITRAKALIHGFAVAVTDTGHDASVEPLATFGVNRQKVYDWAFRGVHTTAMTAKRLMEAYYSARPAHAYFDGCSTGGRQGLMLAQRFPDDFDGIVVGAPVLNFTATAISWAWMAQALAAAPVPVSKLKLLATKIYAQCDAKDGLTDGVIEDPRLCGFQPSRDLPRCGAGDGEDCFTPAQIGTLEKIYADVMSQGKRFFPGWPVSAEIAGANGKSGWQPWIIAESGRTITVTFAESFFRYMGFPERDTSYEISRFDFDKDPARTEWIHSVLDATDPNLKAFEARGGKIVMYYGWADPALNARMGVEYYEKMAETMGASPTNFFRLFMVPGMFHCRGGVGTDTFDALTPLTRWVEQGQAPDQIRAARLTNGKPVRTRPLCPYPQVAKYKGSGSVDDAANFSCGAP